MLKSPYAVFEHECIHLGTDNQHLSLEQLRAFQTVYGEKGVPYFTLIHNGIRFCEYVGVIQVGNTVIEVLPKSDKSTKAEEKETWRNMLIGMLKTVGLFEVKAPSSSALQLKSNSILDLYFELFLAEVESLLHKGLVKKYHKIEGNATALKGCIKFGKHIQKNIVHRERFYISYSTFDAEHKLHFILYKTIRLLKHINTSTILQSRIGALLLNFPEMPDINVSEVIFDSITYNRKTEPYRKAIEIARLILLQYHPDISTGRNHVLALMFDMNALWEQFVYVSLRQSIRKNYAGYHIKAQIPVDFWKPENGYKSRIQPDIIIENDNKKLVWDTKWKNLGTGNPSPDDLRQMYAYHEYCQADKVALVYPGEHPPRKGNYYKPGENHPSDKECSIISIPVGKDIREFQKNIWDAFAGWIVPERLTP